MLWTCGSSPNQLDQSSVHCLWACSTVMQSYITLSNTVLQTKTVYDSTPGPHDTYRLSNLYFLLSNDLLSSLIWLSVATIFSPLHSMSSLSSHDFTAIRRYFWWFSADFTTMSYSTQHIPNNADWVMWWSLFGSNLSETWVLNPLLY